MIYIASPYTHDSYDVMEKRYQSAMHYQAHLIRSGFPCYSPIVAMHPLACVHDLPKHVDFWHAFNLDMIKACSLIHILKIEGWNESIGIQKEVELAQSLHIPVIPVNEPQQP